MALKVKKDIYIEDTGKTLGDLVTYVNNRRTVQVYNPSTGEPTWVKVLHLPGTGSYSEITCMFSIMSTMQTLKTECICSITYYNNSTIKPKILCGTFNNYDIGYIKNSDNTLDVYIYSCDNYKPIYVTVLSLQEEFEEFDIYQNGTLPAVVSTPSLTGYFQYDMDDYTSSITFTNSTLTGGGVYKCGKVVYFQICVKATATSGWGTLFKIPSEIYPIAVYDNGASVGSVWVYRDGTVRRAIESGSVYNITGSYLIK